MVQFMSEYEVVPRRADNDEVLDGRIDCGKVDRHHQRAQFKIRQAAEIREQKQMSRIACDKVLVRRHTLCNTT